MITMMTRTTTTVAIPLEELPNELPDLLTSLTLWFMFFWELVELISGLFVSFKRDATLSCCSATLDKPYEYSYQFEILTSDAIRIEPGQLSVGAVLTDNFTPFFSSKSFLDLSKCYGAPPSCRTITMTSAWFPYRSRPHGKIANVHRLGWFHEPCSISSWRAIRSSRYLPLMSWAFLRSLTE